MTKTELAAALREVEIEMRKLKAVQKPEKWLAKNYVGGGMSERDYLDVKIPHVRKRYAEGFSFSHARPEQQWKIWHHVWMNSNTFETMLLASYWASKRPKEELIANAKTIFQWIDKVDNWAHSDEMSAHCAFILESNHKKFLPVFEKWSRSSKPWLRRQSMVGILFYSRFREKSPSFAVLKKFIERQIHDEHFYVQKGVGWTLRECWNVYPKQTEKYLREIAHLIPPAGWTAATEKLSPKLKAELMKRRKSFSSKSPRGQGFVAI